MHERTRHHGCFCCQREDRSAFRKWVGLARALFGKLPRGRSGRQTHFAVVRATARSRAATRSATRRASSVSSGVGSGSTRTEKLIPQMEKRRATKRLPTESQGGFMCLSPAVLFRAIDRSPRVAFRRARDSRGGWRTWGTPSSSRALVPLGPPDPPDPSQRHLELAHAETLPTARYVVARLPLQNPALTETCHRR